MKEYFVYYNDDYYELGGVGIEDFEDEKAACKFIEKRIKYDPAGRTISHYTLIYGTELKIEPFEMVTKIKVVD